MAAQQAGVVSSDNGIVSLVDILVAQGSISSQTASQIKLAEVQTGRSQEELLREQNLITEQDLTRARATFYNVPYIDLQTAPVNPEALSLLPRDVADRFVVFPIDIDKKTNTLTLAMSDPLDLTAIEFVEQKTGMRISPRAAEKSKIEENISSRYSSSLSADVNAALKEVGADDGDVRTLDLSRQGGVVRQERISEIVTHILEFSMKSRASDIHVEPQEKSTRVRYRIDGVLQEKLTIPKELQEALISRIKILAGMKIDERRIPQDGRFNFKTKDQEVDLRVSTLPTAWGEKVVLRLLKKSGGIPTLADLGVRGTGLKNLEMAFTKPHGIVLITGPTGSGKTTTLYSIISMLNTSKVNIMTLEDPIEYKMAGVNQVQIRPAVGLTFASGLRSFLRQDPNIILVGEIRDQETADLAIQASLTGHLVFSTLHTNDAAGALPRLLDMQAEPFLLASTINAIVAQRVVRKIDPSTKEEYDPDPKVVDDIKRVLGPLFPEGKAIKLYRGRPTPENNNSGYIGRIGVYEVLLVSERVGRLILERATSGDIDKVAREEGMISMKQDGYLKVLEGITTIEEVLRVSQE